MKRKIKTLRKIFNSPKQDFNSSRPFLSPSMPKNKSDEYGEGNKEDSFVVEWQMVNSIPEYS